MWKGGVEGEHKEEGASTTVCQILSRSLVELKATASPQDRGGGTKPPEHRNIIRHR